MPVPLQRKAGVTLVELLLAGAVTSISVLALLGGFATAQRIVHANAEALRADNIAFDLLWRRFNIDYDRLLPTGLNAPEQRTEANTSPYHSSRLTPAPAYVYTERTAVSNSVKCLSIDLKYGPNGTNVRHLDVFRSEIPRTPPS